MSKVLLTGVAASLLASAGAFAADLPARRYAPVAPASIPVFSWTGAYLGANAGAVFGKDRDVVVPGVGTVTSDGGEAGFTGGGQLGYNYQMGAVVLGVEADLQYADLRGGAFAGTLVPGFVPAVDRGIEFLGTARGRVGYAIDRALVYGTGGFAYGGGDGNGGCAAVAINCGDSDTRTGFTMGAGLEYAFTNNWTAKVEGLYVNLDRGTNALAGTLNGVPLPATGNRNDEIGVVRAGVNYKFW